MVLTLNFSHAFPHGRRSGFLYSDLQPTALNSFNIPWFVELAHLLDIKDRETLIAITLLTPGVAFYSTGSNFKHFSQVTNQ